MTRDMSRSGITAAKIEPKQMSIDITPNPETNSAANSIARITGVGPPEPCLAEQGGYVPRDRAARPAGAGAGGRAAARLGGRAGARLGGRAGVRRGGRAHRLSSP